MVWTTARRSMMDRLYIAVASTIANSANFNSRIAIATGNESRAFELTELVVSVALLTNASAAISC